MPPHDPIILFFAFLFVLTSLFALWAQYHIQHRNAMSNALLQYQHDYPARSKK